MEHSKFHESAASRKKTISINSWIFAALLVFLVAGCTGPGGAPAEAPPAATATTAKADESQLQLPPVRFSDLEPAAPQPAADSLRPGLSVIYYFSYFERHLDPLADIAATEGRGRIGKPIPYLNHSFGKEEVFDSGANRGVAMRMDGMIQFSRPGEYRFRAISNDGLRIDIGGVRVIDDPDQHADRYAVEAIVNIQHKGWYPLKVQYFQRKGTATIGLFWRTPSGGGFKPVPGASLAHLP